MTNLKYDLIIVGGGPIGSALSYFTSLQKKELGLEKIALIQMEPQSYPGIAYPFAGGSIRWYFEDEEIRNNTKKTSDFILSLKDKVDLNLIQDNYFFVHKALVAPSLNISGKKLVDYFKDQAKLNRVEIFSETEFKKIEKFDNDYKIITSNGDFLSSKVIFAMGYKNKEYFNIDLEVEKRQLFVLDLELKLEQLQIPHTIFKFNDGIIFYFLKKFDDGYKLVLGQEEIFEHNLNPEPENYFDDLLNMGLVNVLPFLKNTKVKKILWGFDVKNKKPLIYEYDKGVFVVNCGSAVRSVIGIVFEVLKKIKK
ncbi:MAG: NAD(P)-binding domain-containing protein [Patescibacteria group bacterium]|nr:NAD(P)-binding domain-containing protein [Patescibacteria group bacterium]